MERTDTRPPFAASGGIIPPELRKIKTPCYVLDEAALIKNAELMGNIAKRTGCKMLLAQKAFSNYDCYHLLEPYLTGTEASGLYEARLGAQEMPGKEVHVFCAGYREDEFEELLSFADHIVFNSPSQLLRFGKRVKEAGKNAGLRINPECSTQEGHAIYDPCAPGSRMGTTRAQWETAVRKHPELIGLLDGIHFHTLCEQDSSDLETTLTAVKTKFGDLISKVKWLNLGGGHLMTRKDYDTEHLIKLLQDLKVRYPHLQIILEPGSAFTWQTGVLTSEVVDIVESRGIKTAILNVSFTCHMPDCLEMPYQPAVRGAEMGNEGEFIYRLGGNSCLSGDYMGWWSFDHELQIGERIVFEDMIHYTMVKTNMFNGIHHPAIAIWTKEGKAEIYKQFSYEDYRDRMS